jgi:hypothetical protein
MPDDRDAGMPIQLGAEYEIQHWASTPFMWHTGEPHSANGVEHNLQRFPGPPVEELTGAWVQ